MEQSSLKLVNEARQWLVWLVGGNPRTLNIIILLLLAMFSIRFLLLFWREAYTVIDTLNQIWRHIMWSMLYAVLFLLSGVQAYYSYSHLFGPLSELRNLEPPDALLNTFSEYVQFGEWLDWAHTIYSQ